MCVLCACVCVWECVNACMRAAAAAAVRLCGASCRRCSSDRCQSCSLVVESDFDPSRILAASLCLCPSLFLSSLFTPSQAPHGTKCSAESVCVCLFHWLLKVPQFWVTW